MLSGPIPFSDAPPGPHRCIGIAQPLPMSGRRSRQAGDALGSIKRPPMSVRGATRKGLGGAINSKERAAFRSYFNVGRAIPWG